MNKLKKLNEINSIIDKLSMILEAKLFINSGISEDINTQKKITKTEKVKKQ